MFIDMHCDTILKLYHEPQQTLKNNSFHIDLTRMKKSLIDLQSFALFVDIENYPNAYTHYQDLLAIYQKEMVQQSDYVRPIYTFQDYETNQREGYLSSMLTLEEGAPLEGRIDRLEKIYRDGVRMMTLTWNHENEIGYPIALFSDSHSRVLPIQQNGLKQAGREIVEKMENLGMIVDVSHGSDQLVWDVLDVLSNPFVASHSNVRSLCPHGRNLPDELIKALGNRGCVIGLNYFEPFIRFDDYYSLPEQLAKHASHLRHIGGIDCIGLGSDFDGIPTNPSFPDILSVDYLIDALQKNGFTSREIDAIGYKNVSRIYQTILK